MTIDGQADERFGIGLIADVFTVLDRHGYRRTTDNAGIGAATQALHRLVRLYEGPGSRADVDLPPGVTPQDELASGLRGGDRER
jgi:hypothetical protein